MRRPRCQQRLVHYGDPRVGQDGVPARPARRVLAHRRSTADVAVAGGFKLKKVHFLLQIRGVRGQVVGGPGQFVAGRGILLDDKGEYEKAIADFTKALAINPKNSGAYMERGNALDDIRSG